MSHHPTAKSAVSASTRAMLSGPIVPTMLKLAAPTMVVMVVQMFAGVLETYFVSRLGTTALAAAALVFPVLMLMQMMSNGGFGAGVTSSVARALGAGRKADADALVFHAVVMGFVIGLVFTVVELACGDMLYRALGANGETLAGAIAYSRAIFAGAIVIWVVNLLASVLRGSGNVSFPAMVSSMSLVVMVPLSLLLIFGWGPVPAFGIAGAGAALVIFYTLAMFAMIAFLRSGRSNVALRFNFAQLEWRLFKDILNVGSLSAIGAIQPNLTVVVVTGAVGLFGADVIAGYGIASRLDFTLLPLVFGLGTAVITMVGTNIGAGNIKRARRVAWISAWIAGGALQLVGILVVFEPQLWVGIFTNDPAVLDAGSRYLHVVGPVYGMFGFGMMMYFSGQGAGRVFWHVASGTLRLLITAVGGWIAVTRFGVSLTTLFLIIALGMFAFGAMNAVVRWFGSWGKVREAVNEPQVSAMPSPALAIMPEDRP